LTYDAMMQRRLILLIIKIGLPVVTGQFLYDWYHRSVAKAVADLPIRAVLIVAVLSAWWAFSEYRDSKKRTVR
jgi:hypothetical protein